MLIRIGSPFVLTLAVLACAQQARAQAPFTMGGVTALPGTVASGALNVAARPGDEGTTIPFSVVNGARPGPVLGLLAGTHGSEYPPILAMQRLRATIDPKDLSGTIVIVHVANMVSFLGRTVYYSPVDHKNQNRVYPGRQDGTLSERVADTISRDVISRTDYLIDLHCGDGNESLVPYVYWSTSGTPELVEACRQLALAFGIEYVLINPSRQIDPARTGSGTNTAIARGKPGLTIEWGGMGGVDEESVAGIVRGVEGVLRHLKMRATGASPLEHPVWLARNQVLVSGATGIWYPMVAKGSLVSQGTLVGHITDFWGVTLEEVRAPFDGVVLYVVGTPPTTKGEPLAGIAARATEADFPKK
jgi:uncharacterized protein